ncbi:MAG: hypothetical protein ACTSU4_11490 [Promethearchaeota archaeon]
MALQPNEIINGFLELIFVAISIMVGIMFLQKYLKYRQNTLIYVGITWIAMSEPWWGHTASFLFALFTGNGLNIPTIYFISTIFVPVGLIAWLAAFTGFTYENKQKIVVIIATISQAIFLVIFLYFLFTEPSVIAIEVSPVDSINQPFILGYFLTVLGIFIITGFMFSLTAMKSTNIEIKWKGKILLIAVCSYTIGAIWDGLFASQGLFLIFSRIVLASSAILFYYGFVLPKWIKNRIIQEVIESKQY